MISRTQKTNRQKALPGVLLCLGFFTLAGSFEAISQPMGQSQGYLVSTASEGRNAALAQAGGEFRIAAANLIWDKVVDHYHHQFMAQGGDWSKNESLLPMLQTIITLDPHFVQAYELMGGAILPKTGHVAEGKQVLADGIKHNPNTWELYREMAILLSYTEHKPAAALPYAERGLRCADDDFSIHLMTLLCHTLRRDMHG
ncbi:MAG: hypothetical protein ACRYFS_03490 [Janthinobacterium lividum]